jgi:hypothetical protein
MLLSQVSQYRNTYVIERYKKDFPNNTMAAEEAFEELIKYLWLTQKHKEDQMNFPENKELNFRCSMHNEMKEIDDMWHTFLLHTKQYMQFCEQYFGEFIHHSPTTVDDKLTADEFETDFFRYLSYIWDNLGEEAMTKWFGN